MTVLETRALTAFYGDFQALFGITFALEEGETVAIIGANGAGKSTFLKAIAGLLPRPAAAVRLDGRDIGALPAFEIVKLGVALVPEGRRLFPSLSRRGEPAGRRLWPPARRPLEPRAPSIGCFPCCRSGATRRRRHCPAASSRWSRSAAPDVEPAILLCDELSLGLAPIVIRDIYAALADIKARGHQRGPGRAGSRPRHVGRRSRLLFQEGRVTLAGPPEGTDARRHSRRLFRIVSA